MEAVTAITRNYLQNVRVVLILGVILGFILGIIFAWGIWPVEVVDTTPEVMRQDLQQDYLRMTIDSYNRTGDPNRAIERWNNLGEARERVYSQVLADPGYLNQAEVQNFGQVVQSVTGNPITPTDPTAEQPADTTSQLLMYGSIAVILVLLVAGGLFAYRIFRRTSGPITPGMQAAEVSRNAERTDFQSMGLAQPITQTMTTYVLGDDLYDESFSIDTGGGEFLGEYGVGVSETVGVGEPKKVAALEVWLFDKNDIKTATKVLMTEHAYNDPAIRARLEPKGELIVVKPQEQVLLETATLQLLATVVDMEYGTGAAPQKSYFERITLELAVWPRNSQ
jgi:hypothetical protein